MHINFDMKCKYELHQTDTLCSIVQ